MDEFNGGLDTVEERIGKLQLRRNYFEYSSEREKEEQYRRDARGIRAHSEKF